MTPIRIVASVLAIVAVTAAIVVVRRIEPDFPDPDLESGRPAHLRVVWTETPQTHALVAWSTADAGEQHAVHLDREPRGGDAARYVQTIDAIRSGIYARVSRDSPTLHYHHVQLDDLEPSTTYWFVAESDGTLSRELHFTTAPADDAEFSIVFGSDSRTKRRMRRTMNESIARASETDPEILAFAHGGDYVWSGHDIAMFSRWLTDSQLTITAAGRILPIIPTRGNHEPTGPLFDEVFGAPGGGYPRNWFATQLSAEVVLLTLNTEVAAGGDQAEFIDATLGAHGSRRWLVAQYHSPIYPAVKAPARAKQHWLPLFDRHALDLAVESDGHVLKRTMPIRGERPQSSGTVYIGEGGLGVRQRSPRSERWYLQDPGVAMRADHVWHVRFGRRQLVVRALDPSGTVLDETSIRAKR